jgi:hypothetical protein
MQKKKRRCEFIVPVLYFITPALLVLPYAPLPPFSLSLLRQRYVIMTVRDLKRQEGERVGKGGGTQTEQMNK